MSEDIARRFVASVADIVGLFAHSAFADRVIVASSSVNTVAATRRTMSVIYLLGRQNSTSASSWPRDGHFLSEG